METGISAAKYAVLHAQNDRWVPDLTYVFLHSKATLAPELQVSMGPSLHLGVSALKTAT